MTYPRPLLVTFAVSAVAAVAGMSSLPFVALLASGTVVLPFGCAGITALGFLATAETLRQAERRGARAAAGMDGYGPWDADDRWAALVGAALLAVMTCMVVMATSPTFRDGAATALCVALTVMGLGLVRFQAVEAGIPGRLRRLAPRLGGRRRPPAG